MPRRSPRLVHDEMPTIIYALHDPSDVTPSVYVGMTIYPRRRLWEHLNPNSNKTRTPKNEWIRSLVQRNVTPHMVVLETIPPGGDYQESEQFWITSLHAMGLQLVNVTDGGYGMRGYKWTPEEYDKNKAARKPWTPEKSARHSAEIKSRFEREEYRVQHRAALRKRRLPLGESGFRGVRLKADGYDVRLGREYIGRWPTAIEAAVAFDKVSRERFGYEAVCNFPFPGERSARQGITPREWSDLPDVTIRQKSHLSALNKSGYVGVSWSKQAGKWYACRRINGRMTNLGFYESKEIAAQAYQEKRRITNV